MTYVGKHVETTKSGPVFMMVYISGAFHNSELMEAAVFLMLLKEFTSSVKNMKEFPTTNQGGGIIKKSNVS